MSVYILNYIQVQKKLECNSLSNLKSFLLICTIRTTKHNKINQKLKWLFRRISFFLTSSSPPKNPPEEPLLHNQQLLFFIFNVIILSCLKLHIFKEDQCFTVWLILYSCKSLNAFMYMNMSSRHIGLLTASYGVITLTSLHPILYSAQYNVNIVLNSDNSIVLYCKIKLLSLYEYILASWSQLCFATRCKLKM